MSNLLSYFPYRERFFDHIWVRQTKKPPHRNSHETDISAVPLIFAKTAHSSELSHSCCLNAAKRVCLLREPIDSAYQLGSDPPVRLSAMRFHQTRTLCQLGISELFVIVFQPIVYHIFAKLSTDFVSFFENPIGMFFKRSEKWKVRSRFSRGNGVTAPLEKGRSYRKERNDVVTVKIGQRRSFGSGNAVSVRICEDLPLRAPVMPKAETDTAYATSASDF